jgi:HlyD family secretion protein
MRNRLSRWLRLSGRISGPLLLVVVVGGVSSLAFRPGNQAARSSKDMPRAQVRRVDLRVSLQASGLVESAKRTLITCEIENLRLRSRGEELYIGGASTIISLLPEGTMVKKGDVICELDASEYEELVLQQKIKVEQARASMQQAKLDLDVRQLAIKEYRDGIVKQFDKEYKGRIALGKADLERAIDRLAWSTRMISKGYVSPAQVTSDKFTVQRNRVNLDLLQSEYTQFLEYTVPSSLRVLEVDVESARINLDYQLARVRRFEERLAKYEHQVELCTLRAPHDGFLIYYTERRNRGTLIEEGAMVFQKQNLFYLPDLADMEVIATIHETAIDRVQEGMIARVHIEALPNLEVEGHVIWVSPVPLWNPPWLGNEVKNYEGRVKLDSLPNGLRPGMTAEVEIVTGNHPDALVVPPEAISYEGGHEICYVAVQEGVERREVTLGSSTIDMVEVTEGLAEGEEVVLDPAGNHVVPTSDADAQADLAASPDSRDMAPSPVNAD